MEFIINSIIYSFAVFGVIVLLREFIESINVYKKRCKLIVLIKEDIDNVEFFLKEMSWHIQKAGVSDCVYVLTRKKEEFNESVLNDIYENKNIFVIRDSKELTKLIDEEFVLNNT